MAPPSFPEGMSLTDRFDCVWPEFLMDYCLAQTGKRFPVWTGNFAGFDTRKLYEAPTSSDLHVMICTLVFFNEMRILRSAIHLRIRARL